MATFFSWTQVGTWSGWRMDGQLTGNVSRSGNTVTLSGMTLSLRVPDGHAWGDDNWGFTVNGTYTGFHVYAQGDGYSLGSYSLNNTSFSVSTSQTSASVGWTSGDGVSGSFTVTFSSGGTAPSDGFTSGITTYWDDAASEIRVHSTSVGVANTGSSALTQLKWTITEVPYAAGTARRSIDVANNGDPSTISNTLSTYTGSTIDIGPNKQLYTGLYAVNNAGDYRYNGGTFVTTPGPTTVSTGTITNSSIVINYTTMADGGYYSKDIQYSLDDGATWTTGATVNTGSATSGSFTISGLSQSTVYTVMTRTSAASGNTEGTAMSVTTAGPKATLYGSVSDQSTKIKRLYCSVGGQSRRVKKLYASVGGVTKLIYGG